MTAPGVLPAGSADLKACCADFWAHPGIRLLAGDSLHPGGSELTIRAFDLMDLPLRARVLDIGTGPGQARQVAAARGLLPIGVDRAVGWPGDAAAGSLIGADAERLPFASGSFAGILAECVLSILPDKEAAVSELARVAAPAGRIAVSDVAREGPLPDALDTLIGWIACAAGALPADEYLHLLTAEGFRVLALEDHGPALQGFIGQSIRRLALLEGAMATGLVDGSAIGVPLELFELARRLLQEAGRATRDGVLGYVLIVGERRGILTERESSD